MTTPPSQFGLHVPCTLVEVMAGDVVRVQALSCFWLIELIGVKCPDRGTDEGAVATKFVKEILDEAAGELRLWVPDPKHIEYALVNHASTPGHIRVGSESCLADMILHAGHGER